MLLSLLKHSFLKQKRAMALTIISISMGAALASSLSALSLNIKGKVSKELRSFGANILVTPKIEGLAELAGQRRYLNEEDLIKIKTIFWRHNILGFAPFLDSKVIVSSNEVSKKVQAEGTWFKKQIQIPGEESKFETGAMIVSPWWMLEGQEPEGNSIVLGASLAKELSLKMGDTVGIDGRQYTIKGILTSGGKEDKMVLLDLDEMQALKGLEGKISSVLVSALTTPMDELAYKDPKEMSRLEYEKWYCTGYVTSIAKQIEEVVSNSRAKPIWQIAEAEGKVLDRMSLLVYLLSGASLFASILGVSTTMIAALLRRIDEIALMKAIGADRVQIIGIFLLEALTIGTIGGVLGYISSLWIAKYIGIKVFGSALEGRAILFPLSIMTGLIISIGGSFLPIKRALSIKPALVLKGAK